MLCLHDARPSYADGATKPGCSAMRRIQRSLLMLMRVSLGRPTKAGHCRGTAAGRDYASDALFGPRITTPRRFWHAGTRGKPVGGVAPAYNNEAEDRKSTRLNSSH